MSGFLLTFFIMPLSWASLIRDVELQHYVLTTTLHSSLQECSAACVTDMCCLSFNFLQPTLECQLNFKTKEQRPSDFVAKTGSFYRNKDDIPQSEAGICGTNACLSTQRCLHFPVTNETKCYLRDNDVKESPVHRPPGSALFVTHNCYDVMATRPCTNTYTLTAPEVNNVTVFCDMATRSGGWLVFQRRMDGSVDFYRNWIQYKNGFGDVNREFWLGNEIIHQITNRTLYELRIDLEDFEGNTRYAVYSPFSLASEADNYTLHVGSYSGNAGDALGPYDGVSFTTQDMDFDSYIQNCAELYQGAWWYSACHGSNLNGRYLAGPTAIYAKGVTWSPWTDDSLGWHDGQSFTTKDRDHDQSDRNCAELFRGAWWYNVCYTSNLNGLYIGGSTSVFAQGVVWSGWKGYFYSLKKSEMKIRPIYPSL